MSRVMIHCPETGKRIYTHLELDWLDLDTLQLGERTVECPECSKTHEWRRAQAFLDQGGGSG